MGDENAGESPLFFFDLTSAYAYLAAERIEAVVGREVRWVPVLAAALIQATGRRSWALDERRAAGMREVEKRARERGLPPVRWPERWPNTALTALRVAVYAGALGREREYALAAFRLHFVQGLPLDVDQHVALAAERTGLDPATALRAAADPAVKATLRRNSDLALALGAVGVPTTVVRGTPFWGDDRLDEAVAMLHDDSEE